MTTLDVVADHPAGAAGRLVRAHRRVHGSEQGPRDGSSPTPAEAADRFDIARAEAARAPQERLRRGREQSARDVDMARAAAPPPCRCGFGSRDGGGSAQAHRGSKRTTVFQRRGPPTGGPSARRAGGRDEFEPGTRATVRPIGHDTLDCQWMSTRVRGGKYVVQGGVVLRGSSAVISGARTMLSRPCAGRSSRTKTSSSKRPRH